MKESEFLFFNGLDNLSDMTDLPALTRRLVLFASEFALEGNIWQQWLAYVLMTDENAFSLACERHEVAEEATLLELAEPDLAQFMDLMQMAYSPPQRRARRGRGHLGVPKPCDKGIRG